MDLVAWAADRSRSLLAPLGTRWAHSEAVALRAREVAVVVSPDDREVLLAAAYLHDVGSAPELFNDGAVNNVTVTNNNANTPGTNNTDFNGFHLNSGTVAATDDFTSCLELANNNFTGAGQGVNAPNNGDVRLRQRQGTTVRLPGYSGPARDNSDNQVAEVVTFLRPPASGGLKSNTFGTGFAGSVSTGGGYIGTGGACLTPP